MIIVLYLSTIKIGTNFSTPYYADCYIQRFYLAYDEQVIDFYFR